MFGLQLFFLRRRRMLVRYGAVALVGATAVAMALPRADAHVLQHAPARAGDIAMLLSPQPLAGKQFAVFYNVPHS